MAKQVVWRIFACWFGTYCIYICCSFKSDASLKKLFLLGCYGILGKYCKHYQYFWVYLDIQINYRWKLIISVLKYCTLYKTHLVLQYWQPYLFHDFSYNEYSFLDLLASKYVDLTLLLKVYVTFNDLQILKILIVLCKW